MSSSSSAERPSRTRRWFLGRAAAAGATGAVGATGVSACRSDSDERAPDAVAPIAFRYGDHPSQVADLHLPPGRPGRSWPVVILIHGGFWRTGFDRSLMEPLADDLTQRELAAWNVDYRASGDGGGGWPATFTDVATAVDLLAEAASDHPLDLDRVVTVGHSAGGTLALWAAARPGLPADAPGGDPVVAVRAAVSQAGVNDLVGASLAGLGGGAVDALMGGAPDDQPQAYQWASPAERLAIGVPQLLVHGADDSIVPPEQSTAYAEQATDAGDEVEVRIVDGADHFDVIDPGHRAWEQVAERLEGLSR